MASFVGVANLKLLDAVSTTATGEAAGTPCSLHSFQLVLSATGTVAYEASLDGTNWYQLGTSNTNNEIKTYEGSFMYVRARATANTGNITVVYRGGR